MYRAFAVACIALGGSYAAAAVAPLPGTFDQLIAAGNTGVTVGDKTFYDFSLSGSVSASQINVIQAPGSNVGLEFQSTWTSTAGAVVDSIIRYKVHVNDTSPQKLITGVGLHFDGTTTAGNTDAGVNATVTETISDLNGNILGQISTFNAGANFASVNKNDANFVVTPATRDLMLEKDILAHSTIVAGTLGELAPALATANASMITLVDNTFQQTGSTTSVPLPPAALTGFATIALGAFGPIRRRLFRKA